jgi:hypothetical protein
MNGLYLYRPPYIKQPAIKDNKTESNMKVQFLETMDENKKFYMKRQFEAACPASLPTIVFSWIPIYQ